MEEQEEERENVLREEAQDNPDCFVPAWSQYNKPGRIVTLGHYYPQTQIADAKNLLREDRAGYNTAVPIESKAMRRNLGWTQLLNAFNNERQWPLKRLVALLDPILEPGIAIAVVPTHLAYQAFWPTRTLARQLTAHDRIDATSCLVRQATVRRITFGGPSTRALHRQTIRVENPHLVAGKRVLLLDDIAKSGASLMACQEMLTEAGAATVQPFALGRVIIGGSDRA